FFPKKARSPAPSNSATNNELSFRMGEILSEGCSGSIPSQNRCIYIYYRYKNLRLCRRVRDLGHGGLHLLPTRRSQRRPQATFRHLPMWLGGRDLTLPCFRQTKDAFTSVLSRPDVDPTLPPQQDQSAGGRCAVHGTAGTERLRVRLANNAEGSQQTKLGDFDVGLAEFLVVDPRDESCETAKILTSAKE